MGQRAKHIEACEIHVHLAVASYGIGLYVGVYRYVLFPEF